MRLVHAHKGMFAQNVLVVFKVAGTHDFFISGMEHRVGTVGLATNDIPDLKKMLGVGRFDQ